MRNTKTIKENIQKVKYKKIMKWCKWKLRIKSTEK